MKLGSTVWDLSYSSTLSTCGLWMDCSEADLGKYTINRCECLSPRLLSGELWVGMYAHLKELWGKQKQMTVSIYFLGGQELMHTILKQLWAKSHSMTGETKCPVCIPQIFLAMLEDYGQEMDFWRSAGWWFSFKHKKTQLAVAYNKRAFIDSDE